MLKRKQLITTLAIFVSVYLVLVIPLFGGGETYADFYRRQGFWLFNHFGEKGFVVFEAHEDNGQDDTRVYQANKVLANAKGDVESVPFNISTRILGYLPNALLIALFLATPVKLWKRIVLLLSGFLVLHIFLMFFLFVLIMNKYITTPWLKMYEDMGQGTRHFFAFLNSSINHGMGLNNFLVVLIWLTLLFFFERNFLNHLISGNIEK